MAYRPTVPRLHFCGTYHADVSTVNKDPAHFDSSRFRASYQKIQNEENKNGGFNPEGTDTFALVNCKSTSATYSDNTFVDSPELDPAIRLDINGTQNSVHGKLVDLDPMAQTVSQIWGLCVNIGDKKMGFSSKLVNTPISDLYGKFPYPGDAGLSAIWHGILNVSSIAKGESKFFEECSQHLEREGHKKLVIRMVVDRFVTDRDSDSFLYGRVTGSIRPWLAGQPMYFDAGRLLKPLPQQKTLFNGFAMLTENGTQKFVYVDIGNAFPFTAEDGYVDQGDLYICILPNGTGGFLKNDYKLIARIPYRDTDWYVDTAGVMQEQLTAEFASIAEGAPLGVVSFGKSNSSLLLAEVDDGMYCRADMYVYSIDPGDFNSKGWPNDKEVEIFVTKFGRRLADAKIGVGFDSTTMRAQATQGNIPGPQKVGVPQSALYLDGYSGGGNSGNGTPVNADQNQDDSHILPVYITTNSDGVAIFTISGNVINPPSTDGPKKRMNPREYIDGQVYGLRYGVNEPPAVGEITNSSDIVNRRLFSMYDVPELPSWIQHIAPIFTQYANLYPSMRRIVNLADYASCMNRILPLDIAFGTDLDDPRYMPVTRDLSDNKRVTILNWLTKNLTRRTQYPLYMDITCKDNLMTALQISIELEHATMLPHLCALYSIKPGTNLFIAETIRSVVFEKMLHFSISCNILNSIGGSPNINKPDFIPKYPGPMPGGLHRGLLLRLRKLSYEQLRALTSIELTLIEECIEQVGLFEVQKKPKRESFKIGDIYDMIEDSLRYLSGKKQISFGKTEKQLEGWFTPGDLKCILSLDDAVEATQRIKQTRFDFEKLLQSHNFKVEEIVKGRRKHSYSGSFSYPGDTIRLDGDGIYNMMDDPDASQLKKGSKERLMAEEFSRRYQTLLNGLHDTFNGNPGYMWQAIAAMFQLTIAAEPLMKMDTGDGTTVGLSFQMPFLG